MTIVAALLVGLVLWIVGRMVFDPHTTDRREIRGLLAHVDHRLRLTENRERIEDLVISISKDLNDYDRTR